MACAFASAHVVRSGVFLARELPEFNFVHSREEGTDRGLITLAFHPSIPILGEWKLSGSEPSPVQVPCSSPSFMPILVPVAPAPTFHGLCFSLSPPLPSPPLAASRPSLFLPAPSLPTLPTIIFPSSALPLPVQSLHSSLSPSLAFS